MNTKLYQFLFVSMFVFVIGLFFSNGTLIRASENLVTGYAWADDIGWISMSGESPTYGVLTPSGDGPITGYAWSDNWGWIQFDAGCPDGVSGPCSAEKVGNSWQGFAKILNMDEVCQNPPISGVTDNCGTVGEGLYATSFAGYISLSSANDHNPSQAGVQSASPAWGVSHSDEGVISGYGWNSIVGWVEFDATTSADIDPPGPFGLTGGANYCSDVVPGTTTFSWIAQTDPCTGEGEWGPISFSPNESSYEVTNPTTPGTYTYTLICNGVSDSETIEILDATTDPLCIEEDRTVSLSSDISEMCENNISSVNFSWNSNPDASNCDPSWATTNYDYADGSVPFTPTQTDVYTISCDGTMSNEVTVTILDSTNPICAPGNCTDPDALNFGQAGECVYDPDCEDCGPGGSNGGDDKPIFEEF